MEDALVGHGLYLQQRQGRRAAGAAQQGGGRGEAGHPVFTHLPWQAVHSLPHLPQVLLSLLLTADQALQGFLL